MAATTDLESIYGEDYFSGGRRDGYVNYTASEDVLRHEFRSTVDHIRERVPTGRLLEIGCAYGFFLLEAMRHFQSLGLELCEEAVTACQSRGLQVCAGPADREHILAQGPVDVVVMLDVIEHLPEPHRTLEAVRDVLEPGGCVAITTGDWSSILAKVMGRRWRLMTPPQHLYYFSPHSLSKILTHLGFEAIQVVKPWKFVPLGLIIYQLCRLFGLPVFRGPAWLNRLGLYVNLFDSFRITATKPSYLSSV